MIYRYLFIIFCIVPVINTADHKKLEGDEELVQDIEAIYQELTEETRLTIVEFKKDFRKLPPDVLHKSPVPCAILLPGKNIYKIHYTYNPGTSFYLYLQQVLPDALHTADYYFIYNIGGAGYVPIGITKKFKGREFPSEINAYFLEDPNSERFTIETIYLFGFKENTNLAEKMLYK